MGFNNDIYLKGHIDKQYRDPKLSSVKVTLDHEPFDVDAELMKKAVSSEIEGLQNMVREGEVSYSDIVKCFWNQILEHKAYNAVISLNPDVIEQTETLTYDDAHDLMYVMPVLMKDNIATTDLPTTASAAVLQDFQPVKMELLDSSPRSVWYHKPGSSLSLKHTTRQVRLPEQLKIRITFSKR